MSLSNKLAITDLALKDKKVLIRVDFNVPMDGEKITNPQRIVAALPTIKYALEQSKCIFSSFFLFLLSQKLHASCKGTL